MVTPWERTILLERAEKSEAEVARLRKGLHDAIEACNREHPEVADLKRRLRETEGKLRDESSARQQWHSRTVEAESEIDHLELQVERLAAELAEVRKKVAKVPHIVFQPVSLHAYVTNGCRDEQDREQCRSIGGACLFVTPKCPDNPHPQYRTDYSVASGEPSHGTEMVKRLERELFECFALIHSGLSLNGMLTRLAEIRAWHDATPSASKEQP